MVYVCRCDCKCVRTCIICTCMYMCDYMCMSACRMRFTSAYQGTNTLGEFQHSCIPPPPRSCLASSALMARHLYFHFQPHHESPPTSTLNPRHLHHQARMRSCSSAAMMSRLAAGARPALTARPLAEAALGVPLLGVTLLCASPCGAGREHAAALSGSVLPPGVPPLGEAASCSCCCCCC